MMLLEASADGSIIFSLDDESEIEIIIIESNDGKVKVVVRANDTIELVREPATHV